MKKNQVADLSSIAKGKIDQPSADTKKKEAMKKQNKNGSPNLPDQLMSHKSSTDQENGTANQINNTSPIIPPSKNTKQLQNQGSQETSNLTNPPQQQQQQPPKQPKKKLRGILVMEDQSKKGGKPNANQSAAAAAALAQANQAEERKDHHGVAITKGPNKHHRICFNPQIQEVYEVENWKEYNMEEKYGLCSCRCNTFQMMLLAILAM